MRSRRASISSRISIHALRVEGDVGCEIQGFLPQISIHALRVEGDNYVFHADMTHCDFYPRPPGGGRRQWYTMTVKTRNFYPRPPGGGRPAKITPPLMRF